MTGHCDQPVYDEIGEVVRDTCGNALGNYDVCEQCRGPLIASLLQEHAEKRQELLELEDYIRSIGGRVP